MDSKTTDEMKKLVGNYLKVMGFNKTYFEFRKECERDCIDDKIIYMIRLFDDGNKSEFFEYWNKLPNNLYDMKNHDAIRLEFQLMTYFTIFPIHPINAKHDKKSFSERLNEYKKYMEERKDDISKINEFLIYFAFPYIENPMVSLVMLILETSHIQQAI